MSRRHTGPRTGHNGLRNISASRYGTFVNLCQRRWAFGQLEGLREAQGAAAADGEAYHAELEGWTKHGVAPTSKVGRAALAYAPPPGYSEAEVPVWFHTAQSAWLGYIDLVYDIVLHCEPTWVTEQVYGKHLRFQTWASAPAPAPLASTGATVIHDWKTTGNIKNTKSADELLVDPAVIVYAYEAYLGGAERVFGRWVYIQTKGTPTTREIWFEIPREHVHQQMAAMDSVAAEMQTLYKLRPKAVSLPKPDGPTDKTCFAFGKQCDFFDQCHPKGTMGGFKMPTKETNVDQEAFKSAMSKLAVGGVPAIPAVPAVPAIPSVPAVPAAQPALDAAGHAALLVQYPHLAQYLNAPSPTPVPESGFINPPEAPKVASPSPEAAVVNQAVPPPPPPVTDDLDTMTADQVRELGIAIGAFDKSSKMRLPGKIGAIRAKRKELEARGVAEPAAPVLPAVEEVVEVERVLTSSDGVYMYPAAVAAVVELEGIGTLYINCAPEGDYTTLPALLEQLRPAFQAATGVEDYRLVEFGKGVGQMVAGIREHFMANAIPCLVVDTRTAEGHAFCGTLQGLSQSVVRGF